MNYYGRKILDPNSVYSALVRGTGISFWVDKTTGLPDPNYSKGYSSWDLDIDLLVLKVKELCVKKIWEF